MRKSFLIISLFIIMMFSWTSAFAVTAKEVKKMENNSKAVELEPFIVQITAIGLDLESCSGVLLSNTVNNTTVLTCKHCVSPTFEMYADNVRVTTIHTVVKEDLALLILETPVANKKAVIMAKIKPPLESKVYMLGRPGMTVTYYKDGVIKRYTDNWGFAKLDVIGGCSGTGLFNDKNELIGIIWGAYTEGSEGRNIFSPGINGIGVGLFEPLNDVQEFLKTIHKVLK